MVHGAGQTALQDSSNNDCRSVLVLLRIRANYMFKFAIVIAARAKRACAESNLVFSITCTCADRIWIPDVQVVTAESNINTLTHTN